LKRFGGLDRKWRRDFNRKHTVAAGGRNRIPRTKLYRVRDGEGEGEGRRRQRYVNV